MSKLLIVELVDGRILEIPIDEIITQLHKAGKVFANSTIDHPEYGKLLFSVCTQGMTDPEGRSEKCIRFIPPSQIKSATLDFDHQPQMTIENGKQQ